MADYEKKTVKELRELLKQRQISSTGLTRKAQIIEKLREHDDAKSPAVADEQPADAEAPTAANETLTTTEPALPFAEAPTAVEPSAPANEAPVKAEPSAAAIEAVDFAQPSDTAAIPTQADEDSVMAEPDQSGATAEPSTTNESPAANKTGEANEPVASEIPTPAESEVAEDSKKRKRRSPTPSIREEDVAIKKARHETDAVHLKEDTEISNGERKEGIEESSGEKKEVTETSTEGKKDDIETSTGGKMEDIGTRTLRKDEDIEASTGEKKENEQPKSEPATEPAPEPVIAAPEKDKAADAEDQPSASTKRLETTSVATANVPGTPITEPATTALNAALIPADNLPVGTTTQPATTAPDASSVSASSLPPETTTQPTTSAPDSAATPGTTQQTSTAPTGPSVKPAVHPPTQALYISHFMRPINQSALRDRLETIAAEAGTAAPTKLQFLHVDTRKSHALIVFDSVASATRVRTTMHDKIWPAADTWRQPLKIDYIPADKAQAWAQDESTADPSGERNLQWEVVYQRTRNGGVTALHGPVGTIAAGSLIDEVSKISIPAGGPARLGSEKMRVEKTDAKAPIKNLEELFRGTSAKPKLYWREVPGERQAVRRREVERVGRAERKGERVEWRFNWNDELIVGAPLAVRDSRRGGFGGGRGGRNPRGRGRGGPRRGGWSGAGRR